MYSERLQKIRKALKLSQEEISTQTGISYRAYTSYERGDRKPALEFLEKLTKKFDVNLNYLIGGIGEMFNKKTSQFEQVKGELLKEVRQMLKDEGIIK